MKMRRFGVHALAPVLLIGLIATEGRCGNPNPGVLPPDGQAYGLDYGEWGAVWWNWALSSPLADNPLVDDTGENCDTNQAGPVWFLAGVLGFLHDGEPVVRECSVPAGKALFFPIVNTVWFATDESDTEEDLRAGANADIDGVSEVEVTIDGQPLAALWQYRAESPAFPLELPEGAIIDELFGGFSGTFEPSVTDGYWIMTKPLPPGEHEIYFRGVNGDFELEMTYLLTVKPGE